MSRWLKRKDPELCGKCQREPRVPGQYYCRGCKADRQRAYRKRVKKRIAELEKLAARAR